MNAEIVGARWDRDWGAELIARSIDTTSLAVAAMRGRGLVCRHGQPTQLVGRQHAAALHHPEQ